MSPEEAAIEAGIEAASDAVSELPPGQKSWDRKEYRIAEVAARAAVRYFVNLRSKTAGEAT